MDRTELDLIDQVLPILASPSCYTSQTDVCKNSFQNMFSQLLVLKHILISEQYKGNDQLIL